MILSNAVVRLPTGCRPPWAAHAFIQGAVPVAEGPSVHRPVHRLTGPAAHIAAWTDVSSRVDWRAGQGRSLRRWRLRSSILEGDIG